MHNEHKLKFVTFRERKTSGVQQVSTVVKRGLVTQYLENSGYLDASIRRAGPESKLQEFGPTGVDIIQNIRSLFGTTCLTSMLHQSFFYQELLFPLISSLLFRSSSPQK